MSGFAMTNKNSRLRFFVAALLALLPMGAMAQTAGQPLKPSADQHIGDWDVVCYPVSSPSPCEMLEVATQAKTGQRVMKVSIAFASQQNRYILQVALPLGVALAKGVRIVASTYNAPAMAYRRCDREGCYVEGFVAAKALDTLAGSAPDGKIEVAAASGNVIGLPFSLKGFTDARKAMEDLAREKAVTSAPAKP
jgi:invasion protein IalB